MPISRTNINKFSYFQILLKVYFNQINSNCLKHKKAGTLMHRLYLLVVEVMLF
ncbi:hypothetical protein BDD43_1067 [Mucilaginibacter gracilis]|uniref:Uncharacterized protein n=1 Tax=Mucilaginibacter gracilis TaxID=423350 RepID=A0A495IYM8_9SPHI|nr:hypothetical protein BDD43_1067 [Mucilaginibacter gracilis]